MSDIDWAKEIDETKDYYKILGVSPTATQDELKAAYVLLALEHHPDTAAKSEVKASDSEFIKISEAWGILSRPDVRSRYDTLRGRHLGIKDGTFGSVTMSSMASTVHSEIPIGFAMQQQNYVHVQHKAGSTLEDAMEQRMQEKWKNTPLDQKKVRRLRPVHSFTSSMLSIVVPLFAAGILSYGTYRMYKANRKK